MTKELEDRLAALENELLEAKTKAPVHSPEKRSRKKLVIILTLATIIIASATIWSFKSSNSTGSKTNNRAIFSSVAGNTSFDFYYPTILPQGYTVIPESINVQPSIVSYTISTPSKGTLVVTQQKRPTAMEKVQVVGKSGLQDPENGKYIANLEGNYTGMLVTDRTLLLISGAQKSELEPLQAIVASQAKL